VREANKPNTLFSQFTVSPFSNRHMKCDGVFPCFQCSHRNLTCTYSQQKKRGPKSEKNKNEQQIVPSTSTSTQELNVSQLLKRIETQEKEIKELKFNYNNLNSFYQQEIGNWQKKFSALLRQKAGLHFLLLLLLYRYKLSHLIILSSLASNK